MSNHTIQDRMVAAIRTDEKVGYGSCSAVDECMTDAELIAAIIEPSGATTVRQAVAAARKFDRLERSLYAERLAGTYF